MRVIVTMAPGDTCEWPPKDACPCEEAVQIDVPDVGTTWIVNLRSMEDLLRFVEEHGACTIRSSRVDDFELEIALSSCR